MTAASTRTVYARHWPLRQGVGLVELMISLVISAGLLTATAVALDASTRAYAINQEQASLLQQARVAMNRIVTSIRTTKAHQPGDSAVATSFANGNTVVGGSIAMLDGSGAELVYRYDAGSKRVLLTIGSESHVLAQGVDEFSVRMEPMRSSGSILLRRASIVMTIRTTSQTALAGESTRQQTVTLSAAVSPRRNTW
ncbi:MAG: PilW family protein [Bacillota bacterium]